MNWFGIVMKLLTLLVPILKQYAQTTTTLMDDIGARVAELLVLDKELQALIEAWLEGVAKSATLTYASADPANLTEALQADPRVIEIAHQIAEKLSIDWAKVLEWLMKILPLILPIFLEPKPEPEV